MAAFVGKLLAVIFVAVSVMIGFGPERWAKLLLEGFPDWATPALLRTAILLLGASVSVQLVWPFLTLAIDKLPIAKWDRSRVMITGILIFITGIVTAAVGARVIYVASGAMRTQMVSVPTIPVPEPPTFAPPTPPSPEEIQKQHRRSPLESRSKLELAARDAAGTPIRVEFGQSGIEVLRVKDGETEYQVKVSIAGSMGAWIFPASNSPKPIYISKTIEHGKPIDIRQLRHSKAQDTFQIGEHAFVVLPDGKMLQLILVGVQWYREGDDIDELRFKYKIYPPEEFLFDSL
jgi:hypothetical protein